MAQVGVLAALATPMRRWYVYVVRCADGTLYCGTTTNVRRRISEHNTSKRGAKYTRSRRPVTLASVRQAGTRGEALRLEAEIKALPKADKEGMVSDGKAAASATEEDRSVDQG